MSSQPLFNPVVQQVHPLPSGPRVRRRDGVTEVVLCVQVQNTVCRHAVVKSGLSLASNGIVSYFISAGVKKHFEVVQLGAQSYKPGTGLDFRSPKCEPREPDSSGKAEAADREPEVVRGYRKRSLQTSRYKL
ncbi:hypothetical protein INR49_000699 [Caranx melampygus]|nr:hypothetical protein INR49_000699 [Caranx melampygus]